MSGADGQDVIIRARGVKRIYRMGGEEVHALRGVDLDIARGEYLSIMGPSGSGKSTLFNMIGGLDRPSAGQVFLDGHDIAGLGERKLAWLRCKKIGYIFQSFNLMPTLSALENVTLPLIFSGMPLEDAEKQAAQVLGRVGLGNRLEHRPLELSGGQQQRVACARAIANSPAVILADEPTGNLDLKTGEEILGLLKELQRESGATVICATHDHKMLAASDRVVWIRDGLIDRIANREELRITVGTMDGQAVA
jgi:putative ABC transport system ATP-binding protein